MSFTKLPEKRGKLGMPDLVAKMRSIEQHRPPSFSMESDNNGKSMLKYYLKWPRRFTLVLRFIWRRKI